MTETYKIQYRDRYDRWHQRRGGFDLASNAVREARNDSGRRWRVVDAQGREVASSLSELTTGHSAIAREVESLRNERDAATRDQASLATLLNVARLERDAAEARLATLAAKARQAKSQAAAPDYDEQATREALWALVFAVLSNL